MAQKIYIVTLTDERCPYERTDTEDLRTTEVTYCPDISTAESVEREIFEEIAETEDYQSWLAYQRRSNLTDESFEEYCELNGFFSEIKEGFIVDSTRKDTK